MIVHEFLTRKNGIRTHRFYRSARLRKDWVLLVTFIDRVDYPVNYWHPELDAAIRREGYMVRERKRAWR